MSAEGYVELRAATAFSFLRGASRPEELIETAARLGYRRIAITDRNGLYGVVQAHRAGQEHGVEVIPGGEITVSDPSGPKTGASHASQRLSESAGDEPRLVLLPLDRSGYGHLCRLLTLGRRRVGKGGFSLSFEDVAEHAAGLFAIHVGGALDPARLAVEREVFGDRLALEIHRRFLPSDRSRLEAAHAASGRYGIPLVATGGVLMHVPERKPLQDILTCIRLGLRLDEGGRRLLPNRSAHLRSGRAMAALFPDCPEAVEESVRIADRCAFRLDELRQEFTLEVLPDGETGMGYLRKLVARGVEERWPQGAPVEVERQVHHELDLIAELDFSGYFLTVWDIVRWARSRDILCQGRGSAANSVVCYALGITSIDPIRMNLLFERFISVERGEPPDIDVDFEHDRREEVMQYVFQKYGRERAAMVANVICYRDKLAFREVGKVFGLGEDQLDRLSKTRSYWGPTPMAEADLREAGLDPDDPRVGQVVRWGSELVGFPRHLGLHSGGFVITRQPLVEIVPVENATMPHRTVIAWDKRDVETLGLVKVDLLALGMLSVVRRSFDYVRESEGLELGLASVPAEDDRVYEMIRGADTMGTFQVESRAQMQMLPRLRPKTFYDLVVSVAIVRPGPIQGDMIHPYLRRRDGEETVDYPHPALEDILGKTYGIPLFQEQVMKMAVAVAGFTPGEADQLRRAIGWQSQLHIDQMKERLVEGMLKNGLTQDYAERIFKMIQGFGGYGFPESHAASFALIGYASCYLKRYHPAAFLVGLLNSQPMGFYRPHTLVADGQRHGVEARPICIHRSAWDARLEEPDTDRAEQWWKASDHPERHHTPWADAKKKSLRYGCALQPAVRLGFRSLSGMSERVAQQIEEARVERSFQSLGDVVRRANLPRDHAMRLAAAGAFAAFGYDRRRALWEVLTMARAGPLFAGVSLLPGRAADARSTVSLPQMTPSERIQADYETVGMCLETHPMHLLREDLKREGVLGTRDLKRVPRGKRIEVGGLVVIRQRPSTAQGVVFITIEDEDGHMNLVVFNPIFQRFKHLARDAPMLRATGKLERTGDVLNIVVDRFDPLTDPSQLEPVSRDFR